MYIYVPRCPGPRRGGRRSRAARGWPRRAHRSAPGRRQPARGPMTSQLHSPMTLQLHKQYLQHWPTMWPHGFTTSQTVSLQNVFMKGPVEEDGDLGQGEAGHGAPVDPHQDVTDLPVVKSWGRSAECKVMGQNVRTWGRSSHDFTTSRTMSLQTTLQKGPSTCPIVHPPNYFTRVGRTAQYFPSRIRLKFPLKVTVFFEKLPYYVIRYLFKLFFLRSDADDRMHVPVSRSGEKPQAYSGEPPNRIWRKKK